MSNACKAVKVFQLGDRTTVKVQCGKVDGHTPSLHERTDSSAGGGSTVVFRWPR